MKLDLIPAAYILLRKENKILLMRRLNTGYADGSYAFPAGHVEVGESFTDCAIREANEEIGIQIKKEDLKITHILQRGFKSKPSYQRMDVFFEVESYEGDILNKEPHKCDHLDWFLADQIPQNTIPYIQHVLRQIEKGNFYSEFFT